MYCSKCGRQLPDGTVNCPNCDPIVVNPEPQVQQKNSLFKAPGKGSKSYAALFTALLVFPATICTAIDLAFDKYDYWFGYVVGALIVTWVLAVLPVLRITPPLVTAFICFGAIVSYTFYIVHKTGHFMWLSKFILPMFILTAAFIAIDVSLIGSKRLKGLHILSLLSLESALYLVCLEATLDNWINGVIDLKWSLIVACGFISVVAVLEAFSYIGRINKK
ncbi:MAG: hypothetical protein IJZ07_03590 [Clostridia bacterium]|nr:hypothetical protein [Clostridia bacterium]